jgi:hypothetical protein
VPSLERVVMSCLEKKREDRPQTAAELDAFLAACADVPEWSQADARDAGGCCIALSASAGRQDEYRRVYLGTSLGFAVFVRPAPRGLHRGLDFDRPIMAREYRRRSHHAPVRLAAAVQPLILPAH